MLQDPAVKLANHSQDKLRDLSDHQHHPNIFVPQRQGYMTEPPVLWFVWVEGIEPGLTASGTAMLPLSLIRPQQS